MKLLASALAILVAVVLWAPGKAAADLEPFAFVSIHGGAEREGTGSENHAGSSGGRGTLMGVGILPVGQNWGFQGMLSYVGGKGSRFGASLGPIMGWNGALPLVGGMGGKTGLFVAYQHRTDHIGDFFWLRPSVALYYAQSNVNVWLSQGLSQGLEKGGHDGNSSYRQRRDLPSNQLNATWSYFGPRDLAPFLRKDNYEFTLGAQINNMWGEGMSDARTGLGPVFGFSFMPMNNVVVDVVRVTADSRSRFRAASGLQYGLGGNAKNLKEFRRQYLEPATAIDGPGIVTVISKESN